MQEEHGVSVGIAGQLNGKPSAAVCPYRVLQDRPLPWSCRWLYFGDVTSSMQPLVRQRKGSGLGYQPPRTANRLEGPVKDLVSPVGPDSERRRLQVTVYAPPAPQQRRIRMPGS